jgi:hypothetical protein
MVGWLVRWLVGWPACCFLGTPRWFEYDTLYARPCCFPRVKKHSWPAALPGWIAYEGLVSNPLFYLILLSGGYTSGSRLLGFTKPPPEHEYRKLNGSEQVRWQFRYSLYRVDSTQVKPPGPSSRGTSISTLRGPNQLHPNRNHHLFEFLTPSLFFQLARARNQNVKGSGYLYTKRSWPTMSWELRQLTASNALLRSTSKK